MLIHELVHVWQAQQGVNLLAGKLQGGDGPVGLWLSAGCACGWGELNIEQQAMVVEHRFRAVAGPAGAGGRGLL